MLKCENDGICVGPLRVYRLARFCWRLVDFLGREKIRGMVLNGVAHFIPFFLHLLTYSLTRLIVECLPAVGFSCVPCCGLVCLID